MSSLTRLPLVAVLLLFLSGTLAQAQSPSEAGQTSAWVYVGEAGGGLFAGALTAAVGGIVGMATLAPLWSHNPVEEGMLGGAILGGWLGAPAGIGLGTWVVGDMAKHRGSFGKTLGWAYLPHAAGVLMIAGSFLLSHELGGEQIYEGPRFVASQVLFGIGFFGSLAASPVAAIVAHDRSNPGRLSQRLAPASFALEREHTPNGGSCLALRARLLSVGI